MAKSEKRFVLSISQRDYADYLTLKDAGFDLESIFRVGLDVSWRSHFGGSRCKNRHRSVSKWVQRDLFDN